LRLTPRSAGFAGIVAIAAIVLLAGASMATLPASVADPPGATNSLPGSGSRDFGALIADLWPSPVDPTETASLAATPPPTDTPAPTASPTRKPTPKPTAKPTAKPRPKPIVYPDTVAGARAYVKARIGTRQYNCINAIWTPESKWNPRAGNPSGAYGIPQAFPGSKMAAFGSNWLTSPITQVKWGIWYVDSRYGSACAAWDFWQANGWY